MALAAPEKNNLRVWSQPHSHPNERFITVLVGNLPHWHGPEFR